MRADGTGAHTMRTYAVIYAYCAQVMVGSASVAIRHVDVFRMLCNVHVPCSDSLQYL